MAELYFYNRHVSTKFIIKNIAEGNKTIRLFNYPILNGQTRDLMSIPGVSEADIRYSLLRGDIFIKLQNKEATIVDTDIDLLQFNEEQKEFLIANGVAAGTEVTTFSSDQVNLIDAKDANTLIAAEAYTDTLVRNFSNRVVVAKSGGNFTSIKAAIDSISDNSDTNPYIIDVFPGVYSEDPFSLKQFVAVSGRGELYTVIIETTNNSTHFITAVSASTLSNVSISGPTGNGWAAINYTDESMAPCILNHVTILSGYYGIWCHPTSGAGQIHLQFVVNQYNGSAIQYFAYVTDFGRLVANNSGYMNGPIGSLNTGFYVSGSNAEARLDSCFHLCDGSTGIFADQGAYVRATSLTISKGSTGIHIGGTGSGTTINCSATTLGFDLSNSVIIDTDSATFTFIGSADFHSANFGNANVSGILNDSAEPNSGARLIGNFYTGTNTTNQFPLGEYSRAVASSGLTSGGSATIGTGLNINVTAGIGFVSLSVDIIKKVSWIDTIFAVDANIDRGWLYIDDTGTFFSSNFTPSNHNNIILCEFATDASNIIAIDSYNPSLPQHISDAQSYAEDVIGPIWVSGGGVTIHDFVSLQLDVDTTTYYTSDDKKTAPGNSAITFTTWFRNGSAWNKLTGQTAIDPDHYDSGTGSLVSVPDGYFKRDLLFVATDGVTATYHLVLSTSIFETELLSILDPLPPDFLKNSALRLAAIITQKGATTIASILDGRPRLGQNIPSIQLGVTDHGQLSGLLNDDHPQYQLRTEKGQINGYAGLNGSAQIATANIPFSDTAPDVVDASGADPGILNEISRADHKHDLVFGDPIALLIGATESPGVAVSAALSDHSHAIVAPSAPANVTKAAANAGASTAFARDDHKHDITTTTASSLLVGGSNAEGSAASLARSDHLHALPAFGTISGTFAQGNDSRLSDDRTASGLRTATTVVAISGDTAPTSGQALVASSGTAATWTSVVPATRNLTAGAGLTGTGDLSADRTFNIGANADGSITVNVDDIQVGILATDAQHGARGGGTQHAVAVAGGAAGFITGADQTKLNGLVNPTSYIARGITAATITTGSDVLVTGMTLTPAAGTYLVTFSGEIITSSSGATTTIDIWVNGALSNTASQRAIISSNTTNQIGFCSQEIITVDGSQAIEGRGRRTAGTSTILGRTLTAFRVV